MSNPGAVPIQINTPVGALRINLGDTAFKTLVPAVPGLGDYANYSDADLEGFLSGASDNIARATGVAYMQLAAVYAATGKSIKTNDLAIDTRQRGADLLAVAKSWLADADQADQIEGAGYVNTVNAFIDTRARDGRRSRDTPPLL